MMQAHRPEPRWRWYAGLALECAVLAVFAAAVVTAMSVL